MNVSNLDSLKTRTESFNYLKQRFYKELVNGFYVYAKKKEKDNDDNNVDDCVNYITRYTSRPPMAENCIKYEDDKKMIRWWYNHHEDEKYMKVLKTFKWSDTMASIQTGIKSI